MPPLPQQFGQFALQLQCKMDDTSLRYLIKQQKLGFDTTRYCFKVCCTKTIFRITGLKN